ncbi:hypothetical protein BDR04DRAFT_1227946 [Suillus decipiens]|nr:hypothetical protein BDR04DRAFT_1227946 [Suillus decipiens]
MHDREDESLLLGSAFVALVDADASPRASLHCFTLQFLSVSLAPFDTSLASFLGTSFAYRFNVLDAIELPAFTRVPPVVTHGLNWVDLREVDAILCRIALTLLVKTNLWADDFSSHRFSGQPGNIGAAAELIEPNIKSDGTIRRSQVFLLSKDVIVDIELGRKLALQ